MDYDRIRTFIKGYIKEDTAELESLYSDAVSREIPVIREDTADYLKVLLNIVKPGRILEVGTAVGYSSIFMAEALSGKCVIDTIEYDEERADEAEENFKRFGVADIIHLRRGDAAEVMADMAEEDNEPYDFIFIDAAKSQNIIYFTHAMKMVHPGSLIVTDNMLGSGLILESHFLVEKRDRTIHDKMREYIHLIKNDERLETAILSIGDGIAVSVVKENDSE
jgi:predicted O-methyltransferase YrrM